LRRRVRRLDPGVNGAGGFGNAATRLAGVGEGLEQEVGPGRDVKMEVGGGCFWRVDLGYQRRINVCL
jgi:hypothetical protein